MTNIPGDDEAYYTPQPMGIGDGEAVIADPLEFFEATKSVAVIVRDGAMFVLLKEGLKWQNVEEIFKGGKLKSIK